jgi:hypothetical protein
MARLSATVASHRLTSRTAMMRIAARIIPVENFDFPTMGKLKKAGGADSLKDPKYATRGAWLVSCGIE